ncbi:MAG: hypothetical protein QM765_14840 [Myxococcales bacterium]
MARSKYTFAPTARAFLSEAKGAGNPYASQALGELDRLEALVREVLRHAAGYSMTRPERPCSNGGPRECLEEIISRADGINARKERMP